MAQIPNFLGRNSDWASLRIFLQGIQMRTLTDISFDGNEEMELIYGSDGQDPIAYGLGNRSTTGSFMINEDELRSLDDLARTTGDPWGRTETLPPLKLTVFNSITNKRLECVFKITQVARPNAQNAKSLMRTVTFTVLGAPRHSVGA